MLLNSYLSGGDPCQPWSWQMQVSAGDSSADLQALRLYLQQGMSNSSVLRVPAHLFPEGVTTTVTIYAGRGSGAKLAASATVLRELQALAPLLASRELFLNVTELARSSTDRVALTVEAR